MFKIGDIVKANELANNEYSITRGEGFRGMVIGILPEGYIDLRVLKYHDGLESYTRPEYTVMSKCFKIAYNNNIEKLLNEFEKL